jgi:hypothetical protein
MFGIKPKLMKCWFVLTYFYDLLTYLKTIKPKVVKHVSRHHLRFSQISAQSDLKYGHQVAILENQLSAVTPELMPGSSPNFNHRYI